MKMTASLAKTLGLAALLGATATTSYATEASLSLDAASAYVFRGITLNDGWVLQPGMTVTGFKAGETDIPLTLGVWGNLDAEAVKAPVLDDAGNTVGSEDVASAGKFSEVDLYATYVLPTLIDGLTWTAGYTDYLYPEVGGDPDRELSLAFAVDTLLTPTLTAYYGIDGAVDKNTFLTLGVSHSVEVTADVALKLGSTLGYAIPDVGEDGFNNLDLSAGLGWKAVTASVTYVAQLDDAVLADDLYDTKVIGKLSLSQTF